MFENAGACVGQLAHLTELPFVAAKFGASRPLVQCGQQPAEFPVGVGVIGKFGFMLVRGSLGTAFECSDEHLPGYRSQAFPNGSDPSTEIFYHHFNRTSFLPILHAVKQLQPEEVKTLAERYLYVRANRPLFASE